MPDAISPHRSLRELLSASAVDPSLRRRMKARAHAVLARLDERAGDPASAIRHQRRAIDLYPDDRATWTNHAALLKRLRKREALVALQDKYADHFGEPMPE